MQINILLTNGQVLCESLGKSQLQFCNEHIVNVAPTKYNMLRTILQCRVCSPSISHLFNSSTRNGNEIHMVNIVCLIAVPSRNR